MTINTADAVYLGSTLADRVYLGDLLVWEPAAGGWGGEESLYPVAVTSQGPADPNVFPLGNRIRVLVDGRITGIRYFVVAAPIASRAVTLWTEAGVLLAQGTHTSEVTGWNVAPITPVEVSADQVIVTAWGYPGSAVGGSFSYNHDAIADSSEHLDWVSGMYGAVGTPTNSFPANPITPNHYFADVVFEESLTPRVAYADHIISQAPLSYWRLGEPPGSPAGVDEMDLYGCTYTGSPALGVVGLLADDDDTAMQVAGVINQGVSAGNPADFWLQTLTVEAWIKTSGAGASYRGIIVKQDGFGLFSVDNVLSVYEWASGQAISSGVNLATGLSHHVVCVFQPSGSQMYVDGVPVGSAFNHTTQSHAHPLTIGYATFSGQEFTGVIDDVAIYNRALTPAEVVGNYNAGKAT